MTTVTGTFDITRWDEDTYEEAEGGKLGRVVVGKTFHGGVEGTSTANLLTAVSPVPTSAAYVAIERVTATLGDRSGTFVLRHTAIGSAEGGEMDIAVVPDTATGQLTGLRGQLAITRHDDGSHTYSFEYSLT
ncbi:DUF3224 domain-containing protein [Kutzneria albida]|uniref:DUF3224 domain-containing protein n=1 Tax=Kutzneria albida DSM 43870 TaxID=1449976 RepID=W5W2K8_9PSEU|nr:DUF3224 domain-containing protein [Kutzneria albida]AHH95035.1 hypothetical protein KALB_1663 [Kutzneria albida DSM 43870]